MLVVMVLLLRSLRPCHEDIVEKMSVKNNLKG